MLVADAEDAHIYSYNLPDTFDARLASLELSGIVTESFSPLRLNYTATVHYDARQITLQAQASQEDASVLITPADADGDPANGH